MLLFKVRRDQKCNKVRKKNKIIRRFYQDSDPGSIQIKAQRYYFAINGDSELFFLYKLFQLSNFVTQSYGTLESEKFSKLSNL